MAPVPKIWPKFILPKKCQTFGLEMGHNSKNNSLNQKGPRLSLGYITMILL